MQLPQVRMQSTFASIKINNTMSVQKIEQPKAEQSIRQPQAKISMRTTEGVMKIDSTKARDNLDLKNVSKRIEESAVKGKQDAMEGVVRRSQEGDELMKIEHGGNPVARQSERNSKILEGKIDFGNTPAPFSVDLEYQPSQLNIEVETQEPIIDVKVNKPIISYTPGHSSVELERHSSLSIDFVGLNIDTKI